MPSEESLLFMLVVMIIAMLSEESLQWWCFLCDTRDCPEQDCRPDGASDSTPVPTSCAAVLAADMGADRHQGPKDV